MVGRTRLRWAPALLLAGGIAGSCWADHVPVEGAGTTGEGAVGGAGGGVGGSVAAACGDGERQDPEECDDGNRDDADGCEADCSLPRCDNGIVDPGELCFFEGHELVPTERQRADDLQLVDCDRDGDLDAVTADATSQSVTVLRNDGSGALGSPLHQQTGLGLLGGVEVQRLGAGQLDLQAATDLVVTGSYGGNPAFGTLAGSTGCAFAALDVVSEVSPAARDLVVADLDGDGRDELMMVLSDGAESELASYSFDPAGMAPITLAALGASAVALGDLDGDGDLDAAFTDAAGDALHVAEWNGSTFVPGPPIATGGEPRAVALGDLDGDGDLDAVTANLGDDTVSVLLGDGQGAFDRQPDVAVGRATSLVPAREPRSVALGDLDGDGDLDAVTANSDGSSSRSSVTVLWNDGAGALAVALAGADPPVAADFPLEVGVSPHTVRLGDLNGDGALDIVTASPAVVGGSSHLSVLLARP